MSGMEPLLIGSAIGAATNRKNPIQGAMLGGFLGGAGGALMPSLSGLGGAAGNAGATAVGTAGNTAVNLTAVPAYGAQTFQIGANAVPAAGVFSGSGTAALGGVNPITAAGPSTGMIPSSLVEPSLMGSLQQGFSDIGQYAQQNPVLTQMALQSGQSLLQQQPQQPAPAGLMRGNPMQAQGPQYQFGPPQVSLI